jgi:hypothetical protein
MHHRLLQSDAFFHVTQLVARHDKDGVAKASKFEVTLIPRLPHRTPPSIQLSCMCRRSVECVEHTSRDPTHTTMSH